MLTKRAISLLFLAMILFICIGVASANENLTDDSLIADDGDNVGNFDEINEKIVNASENDVIELDGTYESTGNKISVSKSLTIDGKNNTTLDAKNLSGIFEVKSENMTLKNLKFINSKDAAIFSQNSKIIIDNCVFINNHASIVDAENCLITNSLFENNDCDYMGSLRIGSNSKLINNTFNNNKFRGYGGAIYLWGENNVLINNTFTSNQAVRGGALYVASKNTLIRGGFFKSNSVNSQSSEWEDGSGGAIYIASDGVNISDTVIDTNNALNYGGAIYWAGGNGIAQNITFENNYGRDAGELSVNGNNVRIRNSSFSKNHCSGEYYNGAIIWNGEQGVIDGCFISENYASNYASVIDWRGSYGLINNSLFNKNTASNGQSIYVYASHFTISNSNFTENTGVVCKISGDYTIVDNINFINNKGNDNNANLFDCTGSYITIKNSNFKNNILNNQFTVSAFGKMVTVLNSNFINNTAGLTMIGHILDNCTFMNNKGTSLDVGEMEVKSFNINNHVVKNSFFIDNVGSALEVTDRNLALINCEFTNNDANENGGAVYWYATDGYIANNNFINNHAKKLGGAIYFGRIGNKLVDNVFKNNKANDFNDFYGDFEFVIVKTKLYVDESLKFKVVDKTTKRTINGIYSVFDIYKGKKYVLTTSGKTKNGVATVNMKGLGQGSYKLGIDCSIVEDYESKNIKILKAPTTVKAPKLTAKHKKSKNFKITIKNKITKTPVKKVKINVKVGKRTYNLKTDSKGVAKFNTKNLAKGSYKVKISSNNANYKISASSKIKIK